MAEIAEITSQPKADLCDGAHRFHLKANLPHHRVGRIHHDHVDADARDVLVARTVDPLPSKGLIRSRRNRVPTGDLLVVPRGRQGRRIGLVPWP